MNARRGEVWVVDFDPVEGHERGRRRPALVLSVDAFNASKANLVTVLPITSKARAVRTRVVVQPPEANLSVASYVVCEQTRTVSTSRLSKRIGVVSNVTLAKVADIVRVLLGL